MTKESSLYYSWILEVPNMAVILGNLHKKNVIIIISQHHFLTEHFKDLVFQVKHFRKQCSDSVKSPPFIHSYLGILILIEDIFS